jgi:dTMP kinase
MIKNPYPGKFFVFEGLDGSGQSTQADLLKNYLEINGFEVVLTKEPTKVSSVGQKIRDVLDEKVAMSPEDLQQLFVQDRREHLANLIIPALQANKIVVSDRYFFSTFAFGSSGGLDLEWLIKINDEFLIPDLTIILKVSPEVCVKRIEQRGEGIKFFEKLEKLKKVWEVYKIMPDRIPNVHIVDGEKTIGQVFDRVKALVL